MKAVLACMVLFAMASVAHAHVATPTAGQPFGWAYDPMCCSTKDCKELPPGEIKSVEGGWRVESTGEIIPYNDRRIKQSKDDRFHRCAAQGNFTLKTSLCLYIPDMGF